MSAFDFVTSPEVNVYTTHIYGLYIPKDAWIAPEPSVIRVYIAVDVAGPANASRKPAPRQTRPSPSRIC